MVIPYTLTGGAEMVFHHIKFELVVVVVVETWRLGPLEKGFPSKR